MSTTSTKLKVGNSYLIKVALVDPSTDQPYTHECIAEVVDWFGDGWHFYFDDGYGLENFIKINSEQIVAFEGKEAVVVNGEFGKQLCFQKDGGSVLAPWIPIALVE